MRDERSAGESAHRYKSAVAVKRRPGQVEQVIGSLHEFVEELQTLVEELRVIATTASDVALSVV